MIRSVRKAFNKSFSEEKYQAFLNDLQSKHPGAIEFRVAETPVFIPKDFSKKMLETCERIIDVIIDLEFKPMTERSIPVRDRVPDENEYCHMLSFDFGVCEGHNKELEPQLIEMQGFPSLYGFQVYYPEVLMNHFDIPHHFTQYLGGLNKESYIKFLKEVILGKEAPENVILLEIKPHEQKTRIDFYCTQDYLGIQPVCITEVIQEGRKLYYMRDGVKTPINRIYNRVIFDDLHAQEKDLGDFIDITKPIDVEWVPHPNWFYRISKFTLPLIAHPYVPETFFLDELVQPPGDLGNYVLKPLFSFAGQGVVIDVKQEDLDKIKDPENWILQKKVKYADVIETPDDPAKAEIRIMYLWKEGEMRPKPVINLARLSKGKMIGVRYNKDKSWVGGSIGLFDT